MPTITPDSITPEKYSGDVKAMQVVQRLVADGPYNRIWQPYIAQTGSGGLIIAYGDHLRGKVDMGDIRCSISSDEGATWSPPVTIFDHRVLDGTRRVAYANPVLYRAPGDDIAWCFAMRCATHYRDSENSELCASYTADGGYTWYRVELSMLFYSPLITCAGIVEVPDAEGVRYLLPVHRNTLRADPLGRMDQMVYESRNLLSWRLAGFIPQPASGPVFLHEGNLERGEDENELLMVMRTATYAQKSAALETPTAFSSRSVDGGRTWSAARAEPDLFNTACKAFFGRDEAGNYVYIYSPGPKGERMSLHYKVRRPRGAWSEDRVFFDSGVHNSYPTLIRAPGGGFYATWDSSDSADAHRTCIRFGKFSIEV